MAGKPYIDLYVGDWKKDPNVQTLTLEEKGAWIEMLMLMHESEYRGCLIIRGEPMSFDILAGLLRIDKDKAEQIVGRLIATGVAEFDTETRCVYNRRMKREEDISRGRASAGRLGGLAKAIANKEQSSSKEDSKSLAPLDIDSGNGNDTTRTKNAYTDEFEIAWGIYPSRGIHSNPKRSAYDKWCRLLNQGVTTSQLTQAVKAYIRECHDNNIYKTEKVMQGQTFFGPNGRWEEYHEKYKKDIVHDIKQVDSSKPAPELTDDQRAENLGIIKEAIEKLEDRHEESDNDNCGQG